MRTQTRKRSARVSEEFLEAVLARGYTVASSSIHRPLPAVTADSSQKKNRYGSGKRADLGIYLRSIWESNYARYLNWLQSRGVIYKWEYEPDIYRFPVRPGPSSFYRPDFKVWLTPERFAYHEVKGQMTQVSKTKLARMKKYFPEHEVILITEVQYRELVYKVAALIPEWEYERASA